MGFYSKIIFIIIYDGWGKKLEPRDLFFIKIYNIS